MKPALLLGIFLMFAVALSPIHAFESPYMNALVSSKEDYNSLLANSEFMKEHFPNEAVSVFLMNEYFTIFFRDGTIDEIMPGKYDKATLVIKTDEETINQIGSKDLRIADAVTLKKVTYEATEHATFKTKVAVQVSKVTSSVVYFFDSLFTN